MPLSAFLRNRVSGPAAALAFLPVFPAAAHPDKVEEGLLMHFATGAHPIANGEWQDLTHHLQARVFGGPVLANIGPAQALVFNGLSDWLLAAPDAATAQPVLPAKEMTASVWVRFSETQPEGGLCGFIQDNGSFEKGWLLGYNREHFTFRLATAGGNTDGDGVLTTLTGKSEIKPGPWYHVAATYDGSTMRLFLNGRLEGTSAVQSGDILYPDKGKLTVAAFADDNELEILDGALLEVKTYNRALAEPEIAAAVEASAGLLAWPGSINGDLQFIVKPYLQAASATGMTIMAETSRPSALSVEYAEIAPLSQHAKAAASAISTVSLTGLKPFTRYFYRVTADDGQGNTARSEVKSFQTLPGPAGAWAFGVLGDTQRNPDVTRRCAEGIFALRPNFMLHVGDVVDDGFAKQQWVFDLFEPCANLFSCVPVFPVIGNHEKNSHWYYDYFHLPAPEYFYTFTCGNAEFFMVDTNKDVSAGSEQYQRLEKALASSTATWKFTAHHHPCFSSDNDDYGDTEKGKPGAPFTQGEPDLQDLPPLYEKYGVDIAFAGHIHSYERTWPILNMAVNQKKGVRYIVSGGGGGNLEKAAPQRSWFSIHVKAGHHFCFATVQDRTIQFKAYDLEGRLFDTFELTKADDR